MVRIRTQEFIMAQDNSSFQLDNYNHQTKKQSKSVHFKDKTEILLEPDWRNKERKHRYAMFTEKNCDNTGT